MFIIIEVGAPKYFSLTLKKCLEPALIRATRGHDRIWKGNIRDQCTPDECERSANLRIFRDELRTICCRGIGAGSCLNL